ncbi:hypothetical protein FGB62_94g040 [Gracilaria domingensis]|nr:hypothetical protein FGB62_94g040 [Gracilaria domingensis]
MLFSYFVSERAAREARRRARVLAQKKRRTIIRYSMVLFATLLLLIAASILFSRTSVYTELPDEQLNAHDHSEHELANDQQQALEQPNAVSIADIHSSTHTATDSQPLAEQRSTSQLRDENVQQQAHSGFKLDDTAPHAASASASLSNTSHRLASVSNGGESQSETASAPIQENASSEKTRLSQLSVRQQPLDTIGDEEGGNGIIITLDKKASHSTASRKEDLPNGLQTENSLQAELKTDVKVSSVDGKVTLNSHTNSNDAADAQAPTTNYKSSLQLTSMDTNTEASQETQRTVNVISTQLRNPTLKAGDSLRWKQDATSDAVAGSVRW